jgi:penicillin-binding protein 1A
MAPTAGNVPRNQGATHNGQKRMSRTGKGSGPLVADRRYATPSGARRGGGGTPPKKPARRRQPRRGGILSRIIGFFVRLFWGITWRIGAVVALVLGLATFYFYATLPPVTDLLDARARGSVTLLDRDGKVFAWRGETFGGKIDADTVSKHLRNAVVASEDKRFYWHVGISPRGIASAIRINLREGRGPLEGNGGSTITQQVAKLLCLGVPYDPKAWKSEAAYETDCRRGSLWRKIKEVPYAFALEAKYSKDRDPDDLPQPRLSGRGGARVRGGRAALFRQVRQ